MMIGGCSEEIPDYPNKVFVVREGRAPSTVSFNPIYHLTGIVLSKRPVLISFDVKITVESYIVPV